MTRLLTSSTALVLVAGLIAGTAARAQTEATEQQAEGASTGACVQDLETLVQRMDEDGFWLSGWGAEGYGMGDPMAPAPTGTAAVPAEPGAPLVAPAGDPAQDLADPTAAGAAAPGVGLDSPRYQVRALYSAAVVLAHKGDEAGCAHLVEELATTYSNYVDQLEQAGIDATQVTNWRQEQLALAQPLAEVQQMSSFRLDNITGSDLRNPQDEYLGTVSDVIIEPNSGDIEYVLLSRGGFLGMGVEHVAVPWDRLMATPGLNTLVMNATEADIASAPTIDPESFRAAQAGAQHRDATDQFWSGRN